jgi:predicted ATPase
MGIHSVKIQNFKSIRETDEILIGDLNVLIGPNGAGKSNFISFFKFLNKLFDQQLQLYISQNGRAENFLYFGRKKSDFIAGKITFNNPYHNQYEFKLVPDQSGNLLFAEEWSNYKGTNRKMINIPGRPESFLKDDDGHRNRYLRSYFSSLKIFHFHDTSFNSRVKQPCGTTDYAYLYEDGGNLAAFLYKLQEAHSSNFRMIERVIQSIAPFFDRFYLKPDEVNSNQIYLRWFERGSDQLFNAHNFSDGTLRMICLSTLLLQPTLPSTIIIDEPELGLHPFAINKLASLLKASSGKTQIIISTQSVNLLDQFDPENIIIVERESEQTVFRRQNSTDLTDWLKNYSIGELWDKNVLGGRP